MGWNRARDVELNPFFFFFPEEITVIALSQFNLGTRLLPVLDLSEFSQPQPLTWFARPMSSGSPCQHHPLHPAFWKPSIQGLVGAAVVALQDKL